MGYGGWARALAWVQPRARQRRAEGTTGEDESAVALARARGRRHWRSRGQHGGQSRGRGGGRGRGRGETGTLEVSSGLGWGSYINTQKS
eukprot:scaffold549_cov72-Phaeocystis_antarctica.AAC.3